MKSLMNKFGRSLAALLAFAMVVTGVPNVGPFKAVEAKAAADDSSLVTISGEASFKLAKGTDTIGDKTTTEQSLYKCGSKFYIYTDAANGIKLDDNNKTFTDDNCDEGVTTSVGSVAYDCRYNAQGSSDVEDSVAEVPSYRYIEFKTSNKGTLVMDYIGRKGKTNPGVRLVESDKVTVLYDDSVAYTGDTQKRIKVSLPKAGTYYVTAGNSYFYGMHISVDSSSTPDPEPTTYTVSFNSLGGSEVASITDVEKDATIIKPATDPTKDGYDFAGWYKEEACTNAWDFAKDKVTGNTTLYAKWTAKLPPVDPSVKYTVTFNSKDGSAVASATVSANSVVPKPADPTKEGFDFAGWYKEEACTNAWNFATDVVTGDTTLFAKWTEVKATVSKKYVIDTVGGVADAIPENAQDIIKFIKTDGTALSGPTLTCKAKIGTTDYTEGFNLDGRLFGDPVGIIASPGKVVAAEFDRPGTVSLKVWAVYSKGENGAAVTKDARVAIAKKASTGDYSILGTSAGLENAFSDTVTLSAATPSLSVKDVAVVAGDTLMIGRGTSATNASVLRIEVDFESEPVDEYTVSFNMLGHGDAIASKTVVSGSKIKEPTPAPKVEGWLFKGWFKEEACTNAWDFENDTITANTVIYAKWEKESEDAKYTVTFDANGHGTAPAAKADVPTGTTIVAPTAPTAEGFEFLGWYKEAACTNAWNFEEDKVTEDITLFAKWEKDFTGFTVAPVFGLESGMVANTVYGTDVTFMAPAGFGNVTDASTGEVTTIKDANKGGLLVTANKAAKLFARVKSSNTKHLWVIKFAKENEIPSSAKKFTDIDTTTYELLINNEQFPDSGLRDVEIDMEAGYSYFISLATESNQEIPVGKLMYKLSGAPTTTYDVTVNTATNGTVSVDKTKAAEGEVVTVTTTPATGYVLDTLTVMNGTSPVTVTGGKFTMPAGNVTVTATFKAQGATEYTVTVAPATNGTVSVDKTKAAAGEVVTVTTTPATGYVLDKLTVMNGTSPVTVTGGKFTMPAGNVTVTATFKAQGAPTPGPNPAGIETETETSKEGDYVFTYEAEKDFTGAAIKPYVAVEYNNVTLVPGVDYTAAYKNNTKVYTAKQDDKDFDARKAPQITITGKGNYVGKNAVLYFTINEVKVEKEGDIVVKPFIEYNSKDAAGNAVDPVATKKGIVFTGDAIDPIESGLITLKSKVKVAGIQTDVTLEPGVDYVYSIANNINVGTANIYVKSMGKYKGEAKLTFKIAKADLSQLVDADNRVITDKFTFKAKGNKPVVEIGDLLVGSDYKLTYKNNVKVNTPVIDINEVIKKYLAGDKDAKKTLSTVPTVTATGAGNYTGKLEFFFDIDKADINSNLDVYMTAVKNGAAISSAVPSVFDADGNMLKAKTDFVVDYYVSVNNGEAQLIGAQGVNTGIKDAKGKDIVVKVGTKLSTLDPEVFTVTAVVKANTPKTGNATVDGEYPSIELVNATEKATLKSALTDKKFAAIYTGEAIELDAKDLATTITVGKDKPVALTLGTDYKVVYSNNVNKGTATAYIIPSTDGITSGEKTIIASGVVKVTFKINPNTIAKPEKN